MSVQRPRWPDTVSSGDDCSPAEPGPVGGGGLTPLCVPRVVNRPVAESTAPTSEIAALVVVPMHFPLMGRGQGAIGAKGGTRRPAWPDVTLRWIPDAQGAADLAEDVREIVWGLGAQDPVTDFEALLQAGGFSLAEADLAAPDGGHEAIMFPGLAGQLHIHVDPRPRGAWTWVDENLRRETKRHRFRFRIAHEVAHSFFYRRGGDHAERTRHSTPAEEEFCDRFAAALLVPPAAVAAFQPSAQAVVALHRHYDVSVEVAARALAAAHSEHDVFLGYWPEQHSPEGDQPSLQWTNGPRCGCQVLPPWRPDTAALGASIPWRRQFVLVRHRDQRPACCAGTADPPEAERATSS